MTRKEIYGTPLSAKFIRRGPDECWPWIAGTHASGGRYGRGRVRRPVVRYRGRVMHGYRAVWLEFRGPIADGMDLNHSCANPMCCNYVRHLFEEPPTENRPRNYAHGGTRK